MKPDNISQLPYPQTPDPDVPHTVFNLLKAAPFIWRAGGVFSWPESDLASGLLHCQTCELPGQGTIYESLMSRADKTIRREALDGLTWNGARYALTYRINLFDGQSIWVEERGQRIAGDGKSATEIIGIISDIHDRKMRESKAIYRAAFDETTGLWNRARMRESVSRFIAAAHRYDQRAGLAIFKLVNLADIKANYGYDAGNHLVAAIAERLKETVQAPDIIAALDEGLFAMGLCPGSGTDFETAVTDILKRLSRTPYASPDGDLYAQLKSGGTMLTDDGLNVDDAFEQCQVALEDSLTSGAELVLFTSNFTSPDNFTNTKDTQAEDILSAINDRRITLAYQPIIDAQSRQIHHYECLLRLVKDDGALVSAGEFIMAAERLGYVHLLDRRALELASSTLKSDPDVHLALNVSAHTVQDLDIANEYLDALKAVGPATRRITIELTETVALDDPATASRFSDKARALGCRFAIDDFGSGYTSFRNLMAIEADSIKIDGTFIRDLSLTPHKQVFVRMMVDLAQTFGVETVAEMVGSQEDADLLTRIGVDYLQGFMFGMPRPAPERQLEAS